MKVNNAIVVLYPAVDSFATLSRSLKVARHLGRGGRRVVYAPLDALMSRKALRRELSAFGVMPNEIVFAAATDEMYRALATNAPRDPLVQKVEEVPSSREGDRIVTWKQEVIWCNGVRLDPPEHASLTLRLAAIAFGLRQRGIRRVKIVLHETFAHAAREIALLSRSKVFGVRIQVFLHDYVGRISSLDVRQRRIRA